MGFYRSVLSQLFEKISPSSDVFKVTEKLQLPSNGEWDVHVLKSTILRLLACPRSQQVVLFLDALDECQDEGYDDSSGATDIVEFLNKLSETSTGVRVCISTRTDAIFEGILEPTHVINVNVNNKADIRKHLEAELNKIKFRSDFRPGALLQNADLERSEEALALLQLIQVAVRPLTILEVQSALNHSKVSVELYDTLSEGIRDLTVGDFSDRIQDLSGGLVEVSASFATPIHRGNHQGLCVRGYRFFVEQ
ncbi:hypothetical protein LZ30DRAFT_782933 [Colletotrichum cereale]|nr:hypothetical protein LZ30DRAFT_782933 [Colletotrichum cereale]